MNSGSKKESQGIIVIDSQRCKGCGLCIWVCPKDHIRLSETEDVRGIRIACSNEKGCTGCTFCALVCPDLAIKVYRMSLKEIKG